MKYKFFHIVFITFLFILKISAQNAEISPSEGLIGSIHISPVNLWEAHDSLYLEMDISFISKTMNDCQSWQIIPELVNTESNHKKVFPYILVNGKKKEQLYQRRIHFKDTTIINHLPYIKEIAAPSFQNKVTYFYAVPYKSWMDDATLQIRQILTSCAGKEQWFVLEGLSQVKTEEYIPYIPSPVVNYIEPERTIKHRHKEGEAFLDFAVGKSQIVPNFRRNPAELEKINESLREVINDSYMQLTELRIEGYASPEGSYTLNERLSGERAAALKSYLLEKYPLSGSQITVHSVAEDWETLRQLVENGFLKDKEQILAIIDSPDQPDQKEQRLKRLSSWRTMLSEYFPSLRRVKYRIEYKVRDFSAEEAETLLQKNPGHLNQSELFTVATSLGIDSPRFYETLQLTALLYPADPVAHINMAASALARGELEKAYEHLQKVGEEPLASNNWGVYYLFKGETEKAEHYFLRSEGVEGTKKNLQELENVRNDQEKQYRRSQRGIQ